VEHAGKGGTEKRWLWRRLNEGGDIGRREREVESGGLRESRFLVEGVRPGRGRKGGVRRWKEEKVEEGGGGKNV
jgi:hypothetical protein